MNTQQTKKQQHYGLHVFATGANGSLFHMWQTSNVSDAGEASMSKWACLTPNPVYASAGYVPPVWWWDPAAVVNKDGHIDVFIRLLADKNLWQLYQKDPTDPQSFTAPRSPWCLCNFPPLPRALAMQSAFPYRLRALDDPPALVEFQDNSIARLRWLAVISPSL